MEQMIEDHIGKYLAEEIRPLPNAFYNRKIINLLRDNKSNINTKMLRSFMSMIIDKQKICPDSFQSCYIFFTLIKIILLFHTEFINNTGFLQACTTKFKDFEHHPNITVKKHFTYVYENSKQKFHQLFNI